MSLLPLARHQGSLWCVDAVWSFPSLGGSVWQLSLYAIYHRNRVAVSVARSLIAGSLTGIVWPLCLFVCSPVVAGMCIGVTEGECQRGLFSF